MRSWCVKKAKQRAQSVEDASNKAFIHKKAFGVLIHTQQQFFMLTKLPRNKATTHLKWLCTCELFSKQHECHHAIFTGVHLSGVQVPRHTDDVPFTEPRGAGRPKKRKRPEYMATCEDGDDSA